MAKNQNIAKDATALILMVAGILLAIVAMVINCSIVVGQVGWFGGVRIKNFDTAVTIFNAAPGMMILTFVMFFIGGVTANIGFYIKNQ